MVNSFYVDSCIYLNLWQKEGTLENPLWKYAQDFFEKYDNDEAIIYYSGFILRELQFILSEQEYTEKRKLFDSSPHFQKAVLSKEEYSQARSIESELEFEISFFDIMHMLLAKKTGAILVTRDRKLMEFAGKNNVEVKKPEEL